MAYTATILKQDVHGSDRVIHYFVTADAASGNVNTGLGYITSVQMTPKSMTSMSSFKVHANALGGATASAGYIGFDAYTSGDELYVTVFGR